MELKKARQILLQEHFGNINYSITHRSSNGSRDKIKPVLDGNTEETPGHKYAETSCKVSGHIEFKLKYDDLNLTLLASIFDNEEEDGLQDYNSESPSGHFSRSIDHLFEWITNRKINVLHEATVVDLLDTDPYLTKRLSEVIVRLHQNKDVLPTLRKNQVKEITDAEFERWEAFV